MRYKDARIEDKLLRKQIVKGCKKISLAFKGVVEEDEEVFLVTQSSRRSLARLRLFERVVPGVAAAI